MQQERDRDTGWRERKTIYTQEGIRAEGKHLRKMDGHNLTDERGSKTEHVHTTKVCQNKTNNKTQETHEMQFV